MIFVYTFNPPTHTHTYPEDTKMPQEEQVRKTSSEEGEGDRYIVVYDKH